MSECILPEPTARRTLWLRGACWLLLLAPLFFLSYGQVNHFTAGRDDVGVVVFAWEHHIPFLPWTIVPYWSIDLLYGLSLFVCTSRQEQTRHAWRLIAASLVACVGFLLFPLRFSFERPESGGMFGWLFRQLEMFDLPYNQAPSLHIMLAWLLWLRFWPHLRTQGRVAMSTWFVLIGVSVLTTWQHHAIDVLSGLVAGMAVSYVIPINRTWHWRAPGAAGKRLAGRYGVGALLCLALALIGLPGTWPLLWPALALLLVAGGYAGLGSDVFQKNAAGLMSPAARLLLLPYRLGAWLSMCWFVRRLPPVAEIAPGVFVGSCPQRQVSQRAVLDVTAEFLRSRYTRNCDYRSLPWLDLVPPDPAQLELAVHTLEALRQRHGSVLVHCALGLSRSALVGAAWLMAHGMAVTPQQAVGLLACRRPQVVLPPAFLEVLEQWNTQRKTTLS